jgi:hypothetical protein
MRTSADWRTDQRSRSVAQLPPLPPPHHTARSNSARLMVASEAPAAKRLLPLPSPSSSSNAPLPLPARGAAKSARKKDARRSRTFAPGVLAVAPSA